MVGRLLALSGWLAWRVGRPFGRFGSGVVLVLAGMLVVLAATPLVIPLLDPQPETLGVQQIFDGAVTHPDAWVRLEGRVVPLDESPTGEPGSFALLVDAAEPLRSIVLRGTDAIEAADVAMVTGHLAPAVVSEEVAVEGLPIEATVAGTPPRVVRDRFLTLDAVAKPERVVWWPLSILPALLATVLVVGVRAGYPVFRPTKEIDVLAAPLGPGERLPTAFGGRIGPNERPLADPGGALVLVRRGPKGNLLTAQPLPDDGRAAPAPAPVTIGGSWTAGRIGYVYTASETVPALAIRSELVDATFLFARTAERDRVAAHVTLDRG